MEKDWKKVFTTLVPNDAELIRLILEEHKIPAVVINKMDSMNTFLNNAGSEVYVHEDDLEKAAQIVKDSEI